MKIKRPKIITVLIDTREKRPWKFKNQKTIKVDFGDYSVLGGKTKVLIERKGSIYDLFGTFRPKNRERFMTNMDKAVKSVDHVFLILETSLAAIYTGIKESPVPPHIVVGGIVDIMEKGVQVIFTGGAKHSGRDFAERILQRFGT